MSKRKSWKDPIGRLAGHVIGGFISFLMFATASVGASLCVQFFDAIVDISPFTLNVLKLVENGVLIAEALLYLAYVVITAWSLFKEMLK